jgi:hypothetical protein
MGERDGKRLLESSNHHPITTSLRHDVGFVTTSLRHDASFADMFRSSDE